MILAGHHLGWLWLLVDALAVYRLSRLVTQDTITERPRTWITDRYETGVGTLVQCAWCISVWIAAPVLAATVWIPAAWSWLAALLALSAVAGYLSERA